MTNEEYESCPIGVKNTAAIDHIAETFDLKLAAMTEKIEQKIDSMNTIIQNEFVQMNEKIDMVNNKVESLNDKVEGLGNKVEVLDKKLDGVDNLENYIEEKVDSKLTNTAKDQVWYIAKWVLAALAGTAASVFTAYMIKLVIK